MYGIWKQGILIFEKFYLSHYEIPQPFVLNYAHTMTTHIEFHSDQVKSNLKITVG